MNASILLVAGLIASSLTTYAREFKSVDGSKSIDAEFVRYSASSGRVTLKLKTGRDLVVPADRFSPADVAYFVEQQRNEEKKTAIRVDVDEKSEKADAKRGNILYKIKNSKIEFSICNSSGFEFKDLTVNHWVVVERDHGGSKAIEVINGSKALSNLPANARAVAESSIVGLAQGAISKCTTGCPKVAARAASVGRDRILGSKIQILDAAGEEIFSYSSSKSVAAHVAAAAKPS